MTVTGDLGICIRCLGRSFALVGESLDNPTRGKMLLFSDSRFSEISPDDLPESSSCPICNGIFDHLDLYFNIVAEEIQDLEYETFLMGSVFDHSILKLEEGIQKDMEGQGESIKKEFNREFGKYFSDRTGKEVSFTDPDVAIVVDTRYDYARTDIRSIYLKGRYNKMRRDLPQTRWMHQPNNNESVEYYIGSPILKSTGGENYFLHAAGREDVDVMMLGKGRDFVIEITRPVRRRVDPEQLEMDINGQEGSGVTVRNLSYCVKEDVSGVKSTTYDKTYRVVVSGDGKLDENRLQSALRNITGKVIYQRTPLRVAVRRADLIRERSVRESTLEQFQNDKATIVVRTQSGMYIKELVNGDSGRTNPSLSSEYGEPLTVKQLDVVEINRGN